MTDSAFASLWEALARRRSALVVAVACATIAQIAGIPLALLTRRMVESVLHADVAPALWAWGAALVGLAVLQGVARWSGQVSAERVAQGAIADLRVRMLGALHAKRLDELEGRPAGKALVRFIGDAAGLRTWIARAVVMTPADIVAVTAVMITLSVIHWQFALAVACPLLLVPLVAVALQSRIREHTRAVRREQTALAGDITDSLDALGALHAAGSAGESAATMEGRIRSIEAGFVARRRLEATTVVMATTAGALALCAIGVVGARLAVRGEAAVGDVMVAIWLALLLRGPVRRLSTASLTHQRARVSGERIEALLAGGRPGAGAPAETVEEHEYTGERQRLRCKNLGLRDGHGRWLVRDLTVTLTGPGCVRVVGDAAQRSAFFEAMLGLRRPTRGRVALDGVNVRKLRTEDLRDRIGWVDGRRAIVRATLSGARGRQLEGPWQSVAELAPDAELGPTSRAPQAAEPAPALRLAVACATVLDPAMLLLDDPGRGLDDPSLTRLARWIERFGRDRLVLLGADETRLDSVCRGVLDLRAGCVREAGVVPAPQEDAWPER